MKKELLISAKFDTSDFDKSVESMQKKLREMYAPSDTLRMQRTSQALQSAGYGPLAGAPNQGDTKNATNDYKKNIDKFIREEKIALEGKVKGLAKEEASYKKILEQYQKVIKTGKEDLKIKEQLKGAQEALSKAKEEELDSETKINALLKERQTVARQMGMMQGLRSGGVSGAIQGAGGWAGVGSLAMKGLAGASGMALAGSQLVGALGQSQAIGERAKGSAIAGTVGRDIKDIYGGRAGFEAPWMQERQQAEGIAAKQAQANKSKDFWKILGTLGAGTAAGAATGAAWGSGTGAAVGAVLGLGAGAVPGAGAGGLLGGLTGGAIGLGGSALGLTMGDRTKERMMSWIPGSIGKEHEERYNSLIANQQSQDKFANYQALKDQDPRREEILNRYEQNYRRDVGTQRTLGINDQELYGEGGLESRAANAGFDRDQAHRMATGIVQAGGSARMGRQGEFGLQMERMGQTNASGILGAISGSVQSPEATKQATIAIMSQAFKVGLDNTDFAEENRRFTQAAANVIGRTGTVSESGQADIAKTLSMFLGQRTNQGVQSAQDAYEAYQQRGSQLSGRRGAMRFASGMGGSLHKLETSDAIEALSLKPEELREDNPTAQYLASKAGFKNVGDFKKALDKDNADARFLIPANKTKNDELKEKLSQYMKSKKMSFPELIEKSHLGKDAKGGLPTDILNLVGEGTNLQGKETTGLTQSQKEASFGEFFGSLSPKVLDSDKKSTKDKMADVGDRLADKENAANAQGMDDGRKAFVNMIGDIEKSLTEPLSKIRTSANNAADALDSIRNGGRPDIPRGSGTGKEVYGPLMQDQVNKPKGGT